MMNEKYCPPDDIWWNRMYTESGLTRALTLTQFKELFGFIAEASVDRSIEILIQRRNGVSMEHPEELDRMQCLLAHASWSHDLQRTLSAFIDEDLERYIAASNNHVVRGVSVDFMYALFQRSVFRSQIPYSGICAEICRVLPVDAVWERASTASYQALDQEGGSIEKFGSLFGAGLFRSDISFPTLWQVIDEIRAELKKSRDA